MKRILIIGLFTLAYLNVCAQNLVDLTHWVVGSGSTGSFAANGQASENIRNWGVGPNGKRGVIWESKPDGNVHDDGGFNHQMMPVDHTKMYRFSIWLKKENSNDGISYFGTQNVKELNGVANNNPYFWAGDLPQLAKWYLLVGYIHGSGDNSMVNYGGIYDGETGVKTTEITDFKFDVTSVETNMRAYLFYDPNQGDRQFFYGPRVEVVNGNEPSITALLGTGGSSRYFSEHIGIKTNPSVDYALSVNGKLRSREVNVNMDNWSDYVFKKDYPMMPLSEIEAFIKKYNHLPEIPSAQKVEADGLELGEMNKLLLKKIEELTLHLIEKDKQLGILEKKTEHIEKALLEIKNTSVNRYQSNK